MLLRYRYRQLPPRTGTCPRAAGQSARRGRAKGGPVRGLAPGSAGARPGEECAPSLAPLPAEKGLTPAAPPDGRQQGRPAFGVCLGAAAAHGGHGGAPAKRPLRKGSGETKRCCQTVPIGSGGGRCVFRGGGERGRLVRTDKRYIRVDAAHREIITKVWPGQSVESSVSHRCNLAVRLYVLYHCGLYWITLITFPVVLFFVPVVLFWFFFFFLFSCLFNFILK